MRPSANGFFGWDLTSLLFPGIVYERHGVIAYTIFLLQWCLWWGKHFGDAEACPNGPVEDLMFGYGTGDYKQRLLGQILGAAITGT